MNKKEDRAVVIFYVIGIVTACILAGLVVHLFCRRVGWHGARTAWISCHLRGHCRKRYRKSSGRLLPLIMSNFTQGGRNFLSKGEILITSNESVF